jgi:type II secretory pathway pseudopilin PulG
MTSERGFTILELLISAAVIVAVMGVALVVVGQARDALDRDGMGVEAAQRLRAGLDTLVRDVRVAGAGPEADAGVVALAHALPAIELLEPNGSGATDEDSFGSLRVTAAPVGAAHGRLAQAALPGTTIRLRPPPDCPAVPACGFRAGAAAVVYDGSGAFDRVVVGAIDPATWSLVVDPPLSRDYAAGALVSEVVMSTFDVDVDAGDGGRLMRRTAGGALQPIVDHVVSFGVDAFGDAIPPSPGRTPRSPPIYGPIPPPPEIDDPRDSWVIGENCTIAIGADGLPTARLPARGTIGSLIALGATELQDGPWCPGASGVGYDADLFRVRRVDVRLRVEAASARLRGPAGVLFSRGGHGHASSWVQDLELRVAISPPNLGHR